MTYAPNKSSTKWAIAFPTLSVRGNSGIREVELLVRSLRVHAEKGGRRHALLVLNQSPENALMTLQEAIHAYPVYILRNDSAMKKALVEVERIRDAVVPYLRAYDPHYLRLVHEIRNMVLCAEMYLRSAPERKESRFGGLREDYPYMDNMNWLKWIFVKKDPETGRMKSWIEDIPIEKYKFRPKMEKFLHPFWARVQELGYWKHLESE